MIISEEIEVRVVGTERVFDSSVELKEKAMLRRHPELFYEWDFEKNKEIGLDNIYKVTRGSLKKVWWNCPDCKSAYDMEISIRSRKNKVNCPYCSGYRVNHTNSLATLNPDLAKEWHPALNGSLLPDDVTTQNKRKVWWLGECGHHWEATIGSRSAKCGCPYCDNKKVWVGFNDLKSMKPDLAAEWHLNKNGELTPLDVTVGSNKTAWWICLTCKSDYKTVIYSRGSTGCPYCAGQKVNHTNSLATLRPDIASQWHPTFNGKLTPHDVTCGNSKSVWWRGECSHEWKVSIGKRTEGSRCPYCSNQKVLIGFNDIWTSDSYIGTMLLTPEDGYKYTRGSKKKLNWKCLDCGDTIKNKPIVDIRLKGLTCPRCSDGISFGEKFIYNLLRGANIEFEREWSPKWLQGKRYDFYLPKHNWIIEVHGEQHFKTSFERFQSKARTLEEEQKNDRFKEKLAKENGVDKYIVIDCRESTVEWTKKSVLNSNIMNITGNDIDFERIGQLASSSFVKIVCNLWNSGTHSTKEIAKIMNISSSTIRKYLKRGVEIGWCDYSVELSNKSGGESRHKTVVQMSRENEKISIWESISEAGFSLGISSGGISSACTGRSKTSGGFKWMYEEDYEDYLAGNIILSSAIRNSGTSVVQLDEDLNLIKTFPSQMIASEEVGLASPSSISSVCNGKQATAKGFKWMYKTDYDELINQKEIS